MKVSSSSVVAGAVVEVAEVAGAAVMAAVSAVVAGADELEEVDVPKSRVGVPTK